jgi:cytidylate kinase
MHEQKSRILISVAGHIGSGKSVVCDRLKQTTGLEVLSTGAILRRIAAERGMSPLQMNDYARMDRAVDDEIDSYLKRLHASDTSIILDSRMAWHFLPESLKVYLIVDPFVAAKRIWEAGRAEERYASIDEALAANKQRQDYEKERFNTLYQVTCDDWRNYDVVLDTTARDPQEIADTILAAACSAAGPVCWLSPQRLIPASTVEDDGELSVAVQSGWLYLVSGHRKASDALRSGVTAVACRLAAFEDDAALACSKAANPQLVKEWQAARGFQFSQVPAHLA